LYTLNLYDGSPVRRFALQSLAVAVVYAVVGYVGLLLAIPPGYSVAVWLPSGIAFAAVLLYGYGVWPGILLGSFLANVSTGFDDSTQAALLQSIAVPFGIGCGATLQAVAGAFLVRRFAAFPNRLSSEKEIFSFLLLGGPVSCLLSACVGISVLIAAGIVPLSGFLINMGTWWIGDTIGVFIVTPIAVVWAFRPLDVWQPRRLIVTPPIVLSFVMAVVAVVFAADWERERMILQFDKQAAGLSGALDKALSVEIESVRSLERFYAASNYVNRQEFRTFVDHLLATHGGLQALGWDPRVRADEREQFERDIQRQGFADFQITERDANGQLVRAADRPEYFVVQYIEPFDANIKAFGFDVASNATRRQGLDQARDTGMPTASGRITLVQETGQQFGFLVFVPVYQNGFPQATLAQRRQNLTGFIVGAYRSGDIINAALSGLDLDGLAYRLIDKAAPVAEQVLFESPSWSEGLLVLDEKGVFGGTTPIGRSSIIAFGGRQWTFQVVPTQDYLAQNRPEYIWLILIAGMILTSLVGAFVMVISGRSHMLREQVDQRTAALRESEQRSRDFAEVGSDWFWETGPDLRFSYISDQSEELSGVPADFFVGDSGLAMAGGDFSTEKWQSLQAITSARQAFKKFQFSKTEEDGSQHHVSISGLPVFNDEGEFTGYRGSATDISEYVLALNRAHVAEQQLRTAINALEGGFVIYDADDRLLLCNDKYREYYPETASMMVPGQKFEDIIRYGAEQGQFPDAVGRVDAFVGERMHTHRAANTEIERKLSDGRWLKVSERAIPDGGIVGFRIDITQLKAVQETAEAANRAKSLFLATMSHEIRTPLNGVLGLAQLLTDTNLDDNQRQKVETILSSGQTLLAIINDVLDMSKIEAGNIDFENTPFSLAVLVSTITTPFQTLADDKGLKLEVTNQADAALVVRGDPVRLRQILWNLLSNAIKFTRRGRISLAIEELADGGDLVTVEKPHILHFAVTDTGAGIAADRVEAVFDAFTQEDSTITRKFGGTGLGLAIVKQLTELMGGSIHAKSVPGEGAVFDVYLPFDAATQAEADVVSQRRVFDSSKKAEPMNILIAEDNEVNAMIARAFLEKFGHTVRHVVNGRLAVAAAAEGWADMVLMDAHMPMMNGIDATKAIRHSEWGKQLPIVGLTAEAFTERHVLFREAGMNGVLTKPFTEQQLADALQNHRLLERRRAPRDGAPDRQMATASDQAHLEAAETASIAAASDEVAPDEAAPTGDQAKLDELGEMLGSEILANLLGEAQSSLHEQMEELGGAVAAADAGRIHEIAHAIKGASGSLFAARVSELAAEIETQADDLDRVRQLMPAFEMAAADAIAWWHEQVV